MNTEDRGIIFSKVGIKPGPMPEFFDWVPSDLIAEDIMDYGTAYTYRFIEGRQAEERDLILILNTAERIWGRSIGYVEHSVLRDYCGRVRLAAAEARLDHPVINEACALIFNARLPKVRCVHGDMTFENIIIDTKGNVRFIDPGKAYGVKTPALDRGKLLQSLIMGWEERNNPYCIKNALGQPRPWLQSNRWPWDWTYFGPIEWAFLVTHWVRLVKYWPEYDTRCGFDTLQMARLCV